MTVLLQERSAMQRRVGAVRVSRTRCSARPRGVAQRPGHETGILAGSCFSIVIASVAKQSRIFPRRQPGLLRCARNDGVFGWQRHASIRIPDRRHTFAVSRLVLPELCFIASPSNERGRREDRVPAGTRGPLCEIVVNKIAQRHTGEAKTSGLPCAVALQLMSRSPRGAMHYCPRRLADG